MFGALLRHKDLITKITIATLILSGIYAFTRKPVWKGHFQMVLEDQSSRGGRLSRLTSANPMLANLAGIGSSGSSSLETKISILKSPSVLEPVYNYVLQEKKKAGINTNGYTIKIG